MRYQVLYPDLADVGEFSQWYQFRGYAEDGTKSFPPNRSQEAGWQVLRENLPTELCCGTTAQRQEELNPDLVENLTASGFKCVAMRRNWSSYERGHTVVKLWIKEQLGKPLSVPLRHPETFNDLRGRSMFCCGLTFMEPVRSVGYSKQFRLVRFTRKLKPRMVAALKRNGYTQVAQSSLASYWANGWKPEEWSRQGEQEFIDAHKRPYCPRPRAVRQSIFDLRPVVAA